MKRILLTLLFAIIPASAAGVAISTITCASQVVTVNCTGCGIVQYQGFSISGASVGTYNINSTAGTASANTFTFTLPVATPCNGAASGGSVLPAKRIINTGNSLLPASGNIVLNYVYWFTTSNPIPLPPLTTSTWSGASAAEIAAIVAGTTVESSGQITVGSTTPAATIQANSIAQYAAIETSFSSGLLAGIGYWWNGVSWVNQ